MSLPTIEIIKATTSDAYKTDPSVLDGAVQVLKTTPGVASVYSGPDCQEAGTIYLVVVWETIEHHHALQRDEANFPKLLASVQAATTSRHYMYHVNFPADVSKSLDAPVTEFAWWSLSDSTPRAEFIELVNLLVAKFHELIPEEVLPGSVGPAVEDENKWCVLLGWRELSRVMPAVQRTQEIPGIVAKLKGMCEVDLKFCKLTKA